MTRAVIIAHQISHQGIGHQWVDLLTNHLQIAVHLTHQQTDLTHSHQTAEETQAIILMRELQQILDQC